MVWVVFLENRTGLEDARKSFKQLVNRKNYTCILPFL